MNVAEVGVQCPSKEQIREKHTVHHMKLNQKWKSFALTLADEKLPSRLLAIKNSFYFKPVFFRQLMIGIDFQ